MDMLDNPSLDATERGSYTKNVLLLGGILSRRRNRWRTREVHQAYVEDVGPVCYRTVLRWLWCLTELGIVEPTRTVQSFEWQFLGWPE